MKINFICNDYLLAWNLLFGPSISEDSYRYKQRLWLTYKKEYNSLSEENLEILSDIKNYIPDNNVVFEKLFNESFFEKIKEETEKYRLRLMRIFDNNKKKLVKEIKDILRFDCSKELDIIIIHPKMNTIFSNYDKCPDSIVWGREDSQLNDTQVLMEVLYEVIKFKMGEYQKEYKDVVQAVLELAVNNELCTRLDNCSYYLAGDASLKFLKKQIYPYWLMYLGADSYEQLTSYMVRDKLAFDIDAYQIKRELNNQDIYEFIDFCINNQKEIVRIEQLEII